MSDPSASSPKPHRYEHNQKLIRPPPCVASATCGLAEVSAGLCWLYQSRCPFLSPQLLTLIVHITKEGKIQCDM